MNDAKPTGPDLELRLMVAFLQPVIVLCAGAGLFALTYGAMPIFGAEGAGSVPGPTILTLLGLVALNAYAPIVSVQILRRGTAPGGKWIAVMLWASLVPQLVILGCAVALFLTVPLVDLIVLVVNLGGLSIPISMLAAGYEARRSCHQP